ncbi:MAG: TonB-dependent receptor [Bacteroidales bacterium]|nr:TonB-dependent receptor [Bacteroidales bacterium]
MTRKKHILLLAIIMIISVLSYAQGDNSIKGFVYEKNNGEPVMFANVFLKGTTHGSTTDINGYFSITRIPDGSYTLMVTSIGYDTIAEHITVKNSQILNKKFHLQETSIQLQAVSITADKIEAKTETKTSVVYITPKTITKIPSVGGQADLAQYLQVLPGVVFTGDQGGQLYIRGGSPIQNKVLLDGMIVYNPFHSIGLFSVFDTDIIRNAEVYTGGFGAEYGGRVSSIMDITTRDGNKKRISGKIGGSTFGAKVMVEGPLKKAKTDEDMTISFIVSAKNSYLEQTSQSIYNGILKGEILPYNFQDVYGKVSLNAPNGSKINFFGFNFNDQVNKYMPKGYTKPLDYKWLSYGGGTNFVLIPGKSPVLIEGNVAYSKYDASIDDGEGTPRSSSIDGFNAGFTFSYFLGKNTLKYGIEMLGFKTVFDYQKANGIRLNQTENTTELGAFIKYKWQLNKLIIEPSMRIQWYASLAEISPEPRLAVKYNVCDWFRVKAAAGMYSQNLIAANSDRDVVNLFYGFLSGQDNIPKKFDGKDVKTRLQKANHYIVGTEFDVFDNITLNVEGYFKDFRQLTNMNRNQIYSETNHPNDVSEIEWRDFMIENGKAYGIDFSLKYEYLRWYVWAAYSLAYVNKNYENADRELINYRTHYDRRHNINVIMTYTGGARKQWEFSGRWNIGSGFPFTQVAGFYEHYPFDDMSMSVLQTSGDIGIIYGDLNKGQLPWYHRLDLDVKRKFWFSDNIVLEADLSVTNIYNRKNIFYINILTGNEIYQLPLMPSFGLTLTF